jgi:hypothetical protein
MKGKLLLSASLLAALCAAAAVPARASTVIVLDTGAKSSAYLPQQLVEARDLLARLGDGERVAVVRTSPSPKTVFDNILSPESRVSFGSTLATLYSSKGGSDLGAALAVAVSLAARGPGPGRVVLFTAGVPQPPKRSAFLGKSLEEVLGDAGLVPEDTSVVVRLYGGDAPLSLRRANVRALRETPQWASDPAFAPPAAPANPAPADEPPRRPAAQRFGVWAAAGGVALLGLAVLGVWAWRRRRERAALKQRAGEEQQMLTAAQAKEGNGHHEERLVFTIDTGSGEFTLAEGDALKLGDQWDAEPYFPAAGACGRFVVREGALSLENVGTGEVTVGALPIKPGASRRLPLRYVEVSVGDRVITVVPGVLGASRAGVNSDGQASNERVM